MPRLVVRSFAISLDGFSAAPGQSQEAPFGKDGLKLMNWVFVTKFFKTMVGQPGGLEGLDPPREFGSARTPPRAGPSSNNTLCS